MTWEVRQGECREVMAVLQPASVDVIVTDPPYSLGFMGRAWDSHADFQEWTREWAEQAFRVMKPGAHLVAFGGTRTYHRLACGLEGAGLEVRDCLMWLYGSGFPKSLDVSKAIDKGFRRDEVGQEYEWRPAAGPTDDVYSVTAFVRRHRDRAGKTNRDIDALFGFNGMGGHWTSSASQPAVPTWPQWEALKTLLAMPDDMDALVVTLNGDRSLEGTALAEREVLGTREGKDARAGDMFRPGDGTYILNEYNVTAPATAAARHWEGWGTALKPACEPIVLARKPLQGTVAANVLAHGTGALNVDGCRVGLEELPASVRGVSRLGTFEGADGNVTPERSGRWPANVLLDEEAARQLDEQSGETTDGVAVKRNVPVGAVRNEVYGPLGNTGIDSGYGGRGGASRFFYTAKSSPGERHYAGKNTHPTVKPVELMQWLCRLVTPPGGLVLDPFCGSGSTGIAALSHGFRFLGIEREAEYVAMARRRIGGPLFAEVQP